jgi:hypothetical protein
VAITRVTADQLVLLTVPQLPADSAAADARASCASDLAQMGHFRGP